MRGKGYERKNIPEKATMQRNKTTVNKVAQTRIVEIIDNGENSKWRARESVNVECVILFFPWNK